MGEAAELAAIAGSDQFPQTAPAGKLLLGGGEVPNVRTEGGSRLVVGLKPLPAPADLLVPAIQFRLQRTHALPGQLSRLVRDRRMPRPLRIEDGLSFGGLPETGEDVSLLGLELHIPLAGRFKR